MKPFWYLEKFIHSFIKIVNKHFTNIRYMEHVFFQMHITLH